MVHESRKPGCNPTSAWTGSSSPMPKPILSVQPDLFGSRERLIHGRPGKCRISFTTLPQCEGCGEWRTRNAKGLCPRCYNKLPYIKERIREYRQYDHVRHRANAKRRTPEYRAHANAYQNARRAKGLSPQRKYNKHKPRLVAEFGNVCQSCKVKLPVEKLTIDHIWPQLHADRYPGTDINEYSNLQLLCKPCNSRKGDKLPDTT